MTNSCIMPLGRREPEFTIYVVVPKNVVKVVSSRCHKGCVTFALEGKPILCGQMLAD